MTKHRLAMAAIVFVATSAAGVGVIADRGRTTTVCELAERAIVAHDGFEEILILETDLCALRKTRVIRFIPFPSQPIVEIAPTHCFDSVSALLRVRNVSYVSNNLPGSKDGVLGRAKAQTVRPRIASRALVTVMIEDTAAVSSRLTSVLRKAGLTNGSVGSKAENVIRAYVADHINYFVFDIVDLERQTATVEPRLFRFETPILHYPFRTNYTLDSLGTIELFVMSKDGMAHSWLQHRALPATASVWSSNCLQINNVEASTIAPALGKLIGRHALLAAFKIEAASLPLVEFADPPRVVRINALAEWWTRTHDGEPEPRNAPAFDE